MLELYVSYSFTSVLTYFYPHAELLIITDFIATHRVTSDGRLIFSTLLFHGISTFFCSICVQNLSAHYTNTMNVNFMNEFKQHTMRANKKKTKKKHDTMECERDEWQWLWNNCNYTSVRLKKWAKPRSNVRRKKKLTSKKREKNNFPNKRKSNLFLPGKWTRKTVKGNIKSVCDANEITVSFSLWARRMCGGTFIHFPTKKKASIGASHFPSHTHTHPYTPSFPNGNTGFNAWQLYYRDLGFMTTSNDIE